MARSSRRRFGVLVVAFMAGAMAAAARADDKPAGVTGTWKWSITGQNGQVRETTLKLKQDGEKLTGTISGRNNTETEIQDGAVKDGEVSFQVTREFNGNKFVQKYKGKLSGDSIKGKLEFERNGEAQSRDWDAKRA